MEERIREESVRAVSGVLTIGAGQIGVLLAGVLTTLLMPRVFTPEDYGRWILYRSVIGIAVMLSVAGSTEVFARYYLEELARGRVVEAGRIFKLISVFRLGLAIPAGLIGFLLLARSAALGVGTGAAWSALSVLLLVTGWTFQALGYCERRMKRMALLNILNTALAPLMVIAARAAGGFRWVPVGCAIGDGGYALAAFWLTRSSIRWPSGWPSGRRGIEFLKFGASLGFSSAVLSVYGNLPPFLMASAGLGAVQLAFMGLALRMGEIVKMTLVAMGAALFPSLTFVLTHEGSDRAVNWQSLATRAGALVALAAAGAFTIVGPLVVPWIWGAGYAGAVGAIRLVMFSVFFIWLGFQYGWLGMLMKKGVPFAISSVGLVAAFVLAFRLLAPAAGARGAGAAMLAATAFFMLISIGLVRRICRERLDLHGLWLPAVVTAAVFAVPQAWTDSVPAALGVLAAWGFVFALSVWLSRSLTVDEVRRIASRLGRGGSRSPGRESAQDGNA